MTTMFTTDMLQHEDYAVGGIEYWVGSVLFDENTNKYSVQYKTWRETKLKSGRTKCDNFSDSPLHPAYSELAAYELLKNEFAVQIRDFNHHRMDEVIIARIKRKLYSGEF